MTQTLILSGKCSGMKDRPLCSGEVPEGKDGNAGSQEKGAIPAKSKETLEKAEPWVGTRSILLKKNKSLCWVSFRNAAIQVGFPRSFGITTRGSSSDHMELQKTSSVQGRRKGLKELPHILSSEVVSFSKHLQAPGKYKIWLKNQIFETNGSKHGQWQQTPMGFLCPRNQDFCCQLQAAAPRLGQDLL